MRAADGFEPVAQSTVEAFSALAKEGEMVTDIQCLSPAFHSIAISLKRIADAMDGQRPEGSVVWWLEQVASAANAGRS